MLLCFYLVHFGSSWILISANFRYLVQPVYAVFTLAVISLVTAPTGAGISGILFVARTTIQTGIR